MLEEDVTQQDKLTDSEFDNFLKNDKEFAAFDLTFLSKVFRDIHNEGQTLPRTTGEDAKPQKECKKTRDDAFKVLKKESSALVTKIRKENPLIKSDDEAEDILRKAHVEYLSRVSQLSNKNGITKKFTVPGKNDTTHDYSSTQVPVLSEAHPQFYNCYRRWDKGVPAFRKHSFKNSKDETLIEYYHHSSPVPYEIEDFEQCIEATVENFKQIYEDTGQKPVTEIRLLATNQKFAKPDFRQAWMTYFGAIRSGLDISVTFRGVNILRLVPPEFETLINTRYDNDLFKKVLEKFKTLGHKTEDDLAAQIKALEEKRKTLEDDIRNWKLNEGEEVIQEKFMSLLREQNKSELELQALYKQAWENCREDNQIHEKLNKDSKAKAIYQDFETYLELNSYTRKVNPDLNGQIQAILVRLNTKLGQTVATGCNDAKDRDGLVTNVVEANEIFKDIHGHYPDIFSLKDISTLKNIQKEVFKKSTAEIVAEEVSFPGWTPGLDNLDQPLSGFGGFLGIGAPHNELGGKYAGNFKKLYYNYYHGHDKDHRYELEENTTKQWQFQNLETDTNNENEKTLSLSDSQKSEFGEIEAIHLIKEDDEGKIIGHQEISEKTEIESIENNPSHYQDNHIVKVLEHAVLYKPLANTILSDPEREKIITTMVDAAIKKFKVTESKDLNFNGDPELVKMAKEIFEQKLNEIQKEKFMQQRQEEIESNKVKKLDTLQSNEKDTSIKANI